jgi:type IV pilus assembly protein PilQ
MEPKAKTKMTNFGIVCLVALLLLVGGCAEKEIKLPEDKFFAEWKTKADVSKGHSPPPVKRTLALPPSEAAQTDPERLPPTAASRLAKQEISLTMHGAEVPAVLRALARAVDQNIMINDQVRGRIDVSLKAVPWDQAFLGILRTHGLTYLWEGDIIRVITIEDKNRELEQLETSQRIKAKERELRLSEPLMTQIVEIEYADAEGLRENLEQFLTRLDEKTLLGSVLVDKHTNSLIIQAVRSDLERMLPLIEALDRPTSQVLIEAHIVEATKDAARNLGVQWGGLYGTSINGYNYYNTPGNIANPAGSGVTPGDGESVNPTSGTMGNFPAGLTATDVAGNLLGLDLGFILESGSGNILSVQLQALEEEGQLNILSSPNITTLDNQQAFIESGRDVPYQSVEDDEVKIEYKKAVLRLEVTPHVIDDQTVKMDIFVTKDDVDFANAVGNNPVIITKRAQTGVILFNGQTTVIGGLSKELTGEDEYGVPYLKDVPGLGKLFKGTNNSNGLEELLIFVTPHVLKERTQAISQMRKDALDADQVQPPAADTAAVPGMASPNETTTTEDEDAP